MHVKNGVLLQYANTADDSAETEITCPRIALFYILKQNQEEFDKCSKVEGDADNLAVLIDNMTEVVVGAPATFNIIEP